MHVTFRQFIEGLGTILKEGGIFAQIDKLNGLGIGHRKNHGVVRDIGVYKIAVDHTLSRIVVIRTCKDVRIGNFVYSCGKNTHGGEL